jgi:hypothetical protein
MSGTQVTYTLTMTESYPTGAITLIPSNFTVTGDATITSVTSSGSNQYIIIVTAGNTNGTVTLTPNAGIISDRA